MSSQPEPEWDDESRDLLLAAELLARRTGPNGEYLPEATSDELMDPNNYSGMRVVTEGPSTNWVEKERLDALDAYRKEQGEDANLNGVYFIPKIITYEVPNQD